MSFRIERGIEGKGIQIVRTVVDTIDQCNAACDYCDNFNPLNRGKFLSAKDIRDILTVADDQNQLDVVLSGGEITIHPEWEELINATYVVDSVGITLITNGLTLNDTKVRQIRDSKISRVCISLDGPTKEAHNYGRGNTFERALNGLKQLQHSGKNITVLTVIHQGNIDQALKLSEFLADNQLAQQHHFAAMYFSGRAKQNWQKFILPMEKIYEFQEQIDLVFDEFKNRGLYLLFNHFWPLTGERPKSGNPREMLSHQSGEQNKATWAVVRSNGDVNSTTVYWGRESIDNPTIGNLREKSARELFTELDILYRSRRLYQLPREVEAKYKFIVGDFDQVAASAIISNGEQPEDIKLIPCKPMSELDVMQKPIEKKYLIELAKLYRDAPTNYRIIQHASGVYLFYDNRTAHVVLLNENELKLLQSLIDF